MSSTFEFLSQLNQQGIQVRVDGEQLRISAPQGLLTPALTATLRTRKAEIVAFLQQNRVEPAAAAIHPVERSGPLPLSFSQQRLWFLEQLGSAAAYTIPSAFELHGPLVISALAQALSEVVRRHESLRTTFAQLENQTRQIINPPTAFSLPCIELQHLPEKEQDATVRRLIREEALRPFNLAADRMIRATLIRLDEAETNQAARRHVLLLTVHHIAADGWSLGVLARELGILYDAFCKAEPSPLPALQIQYADFAVWQRNRLKGALLEQQLAYWKANLAGAPELLQLPTDFPRPAVQTLVGGKLDFHIDAGLTRQLRQLSEQAGATLFMTLLAAFQVLLARYSRQTDIVVDTPIASRNHQAIEPLIGDFVNDLALRADLSENPTFLSLLEQVRKTAQAAYQHQDLPFDRVVEVLKPQRHLGYNPVAQVYFALQNAAKGDFALRGVHVEPLDLEVQQTRMALEVHLWERNEQLAGSWIYSAALFAPSTIERMIGHFQTLLTAIVADPAQQVLTLPMLTAAERQQLLVAWNATERAQQTTKDHSAPCLHHLFEAQVERTPDAVAVRYGDAHLTYHELNAQANQLARRLQSIGVKPDTLVAICVERSLEMLVGMMGILKAGGAYVPLDPTYPAERIAFILSEIDTPILLTQVRLQGSLPEVGAQVIALDAERANTTVYASSNPDSAVAVHNLAYAIYTSGSTGRPKGVLIEHESMVAHCTQYRDCYALTPTDRSLQLASFHFDASVEQIFPPLLMGASVVVPHWELEPVHFSQQLRRFGVSILDVAGPYLRLLLHAWIRDPALIADSPLRVVIVGADVMPVDLIALWRQVPLHQRAHLFNVYGPTEATVAATVFEITDAWDGQTPRIPIGKPLANRKVYVLDSHRQPTPIGVPGELHIGGIGPARGYLNRPALDSEKFIALSDLPLTPDELAAGTIKRNGRPHTRLYRTGDLVRWLPNGDLDFLGRIDQQVKIRSFRVELGEIEAVLNQHPAVQETAVLARDDDGGDKRLVAYLTPELPESRVAELRAFLKERLPDYMVPDAFVTLAHFPKTPVGVLDRQALPAPKDIRSATPYAPPHDSVEEEIAAIWAKVLKRQGLSVHDNFFEVGGHSLHVMEVHGLLREEHPALKLVDLFSHPTIRELAGYLGRIRDSATRRPPDTRRRAVTRQPGESASGIAVIGMAGRFPGAADLTAFWELLRDGREAVETFSDAELAAAGVAPELLQDPAYVKSGTVVPGVADFDPDFFKMSVRDAEVADPQQRLLLECAWQALEQAGYPPGKKGAPIGFYAGIGENTYRRHHLEPQMEALLPTVGELRLATLNGVDFPATHAAYKLNLTAPAMSVQTACSTSLVAVHLACQSLLNGECDLALAGGASIFLPQKQGYLYQEGMIYSPDGHCRAFDAQAGGTIGGGGVGVVLLKRLDEAIADGDTVHAVILGSAVNNDGADKMSFTAPSTSGQTDVILAAQAAAQIHPDEIGYIEAHGTGTLLGDPIEIQALTQAFRSGTQRSGYCAIGSVKSNIGHADAAAGVAGLLKTILSLKHQKLVPSLNYQTPNPQIDFASSPFFVNDRLRDWVVPDNHRRCAGVSAFGIGGTNAHVILGEAPPHAALLAPTARPELPFHLLRLSAKSPSALAAASHNLAQHLRNETPDIAEVAHTLEVGRQDFAHRRILVCRDLPDAVALLENPDPQWVVSQQAAETAPEIVFMFPGGGAQFANMGRALYEATELAELAPYRTQIDRCLGIMRERFAMDLKPLLFPRPENSAGSGPTLAEAQALLEKPSLAYPVLFMTEYALAELWRSWGVKPTAMIGHSMGEYMAACLAGVFSLEDALQIVTIRGQLYETMPPGGMLSVYLSPDELSARLRHPLAIAAINKANLCTVSGPVADLEQLAAALTTEGVAWKRLRIAFAGHSPMQESILPEFRRALERLHFTPPTIPFISNVSGTWIRPEDAMSPDYWMCHMREPVRFSAGAGELLRRRNRLFLEAGPGQTLSPLIVGHGDKQASHTVLASIPQAGATIPEVQFFLKTAGQLWLNAVAVQRPVSPAAAKRRRIPLPTYPFERRRCWIDAPASAPRRTALPRGAHQEPAAPKSSTVAATPMRSASALEQEIAAVWARSLGVSDIGLDSDFFSLGGDSLLATQIVARLRGQLNVDLGTHSLLQAPTVAQLAVVIAARHGQPVHKPRLPELIVELQAGESTRSPLILIHPVGGHVYFYRALVKHLDARIPIYGIHARGVTGDEAPLTSVPDMAQAYTAALLSLQPQGPYYLGGSSFGGMVAYAMAQLLAAQGKEVAYLALIDTPSPDNLPAPFEEPADILFYMLQAGVGADIELAALRAMDEDQQLALFMRHYPTAFASAHELRTMLRLYQVNERAMCSYVPEPYPGKVHFFLARERGAFDPQAPAHGWIRLAEEGVEIRKVPGSHISMNEEPHVQQLARCLQQSLERVMRKSANPQVEN